MDFVSKYYQMDPETEMVMFGRDLMNGMEVLIESASCRADLNTRPYSGTAEEEIFNWRMNRWFKVARLVVEDDYINFVSIHSDDTEATQRWSADSGWIVKKDSVPEGWPFENGQQKVPEIIKPGLNYRPTLAPPKDRRPEVFAEFMRMNTKFFDSRESVRLTDIAKMFNVVFCGGPGATLGWRLNYEELREMARPYWELCDEAPDEQCLPNCTFTNYQGFGLTAGQIMDRDMIQRGDPTKNSGELCTCSEHGPCPLHKTH